MTKIAYPVEIAHRAEVYELLDGNPAELGAMLRQFEVFAEDSRIAMDSALARVRDEGPANYFVILFQGGGRWPVGFYGAYTTLRWEQIRDAVSAATVRIDGSKSRSPFDDVMLYVAKHSLKARGLPIPERWG